MEKTKTLDLSQGKIWKVLILFILPILGGSIIQQLYTTVDAIIVGRFAGKVGLAAIDSVYTLFKFPINFMNGLAAGATIVISRLFGSKDDRDLDHAIRTAFSIAILLGIVCSLAGALLAPQLLSIMSVPEDIYSQTLLYCRIYFGGLWTMTLYNMLAGILRAFGNSKSPFYILIISCLINIVGDLLLVGVFHTGVAGAAAATILAQLVSAILAIQSLKKTCCGQVKIHLTLGFGHMRQMLKIGIPLALQSILFPIANSIIHAHVNMQGTDVIAAWAVCGKLDMFIWLIADSMSPALSTYVSQNLGAGRPDRVRKGTLLGAALSAGAIALICVFLYTIPGPLGKLFVTQADQPTIIPMVIHFARMMAPFYIFYSFAESFSGSCCGMGNTVQPMIVTLLCTCGLRVLSIFIIYPLFATMECIVWIYIASWIVTGLTFIGMFAFKIRRIHSHHPETLPGT